MNSKTPLVNKTILVLKHEFLQTVKRKSFIIMTLAFPLLAVLSLGAYQLISQAGAPPAPDAVTVGYVDQAGGFDKYVQQPGVSFVPYQTEDEAKTAMLSGNLKEYFVITPDYLNDGMVTRYTSEQELEAPGKVQSALHGFLLDNLMDEQDPALAQRVKFPLALSNIRLDDTGEVASNQGGFGAFVVPYLFSILLLMAIFSSSGFLLQGLGEEKQNRIMEILLSSVSARQLLTGKVLGLGAAGLVQIAVWMATIGVIAPMASASIGGIFTSIQVPPLLLVLGIVYFILGYLLFAVLMAGVGSVATTTQEGQQLSTIFTMVGVIPFMVAPFIIEHPNHVVSSILSLVPFTAPITVTIRLGLSEIPTWEIMLSIVLLALSVIGLLFAAAKIFRAFLLMYGKRPDLKQIIKAVREA